MASASVVENVIDPVEMINRPLAHAWETLCATYDVTASLPSLPILFEGANLNDSQQSAEVALANMLLEITESVSRFSPWYRLPASAFGLISMRDPLSHRVRWLLAPEGCQRWRAHLLSIAKAIESTSGVLKGILLVENLMEEMESEDPAVIAYCSCNPPHAIQIKQSVLEKTVIICEMCQQAYG